MRLSDRINRLERHRSSDPLMTASEIATAEAVYRGHLEAEPCARLHSTEAAVLRWRSAIMGARPGWMQRTLAAMHPEDWWV